MVERRGSWVGCGCNRKLPTHSRQCALCRAAARWHRFHRSLLSRPPASFLGFARAGATCRPSTSGANHQMTLEVRPAHDPIKEYGFVVDTTNLEGSIGVKAARSTSRRRRLPLPNPRKKDRLPPLLQGFGAVPPLVADIDLSMDDRFLYAACCGTGEMRQYDVTYPRKPRLAGSVHVGGIARCTPHANGKTYAGGPQMVEISRDGKRVYWTNSLYSTSLRSRFAELFPAVASASKIT